MYLQAFNFKVKGPQRKWHVSFTCSMPSCSMLSLSLSGFCPFQCSNKGEMVVLHTVSAFCVAWLSHLPSCMCLPPTGTQRGTCHTHSLYLLDTIFLARNKSWVCLNFNFCNLFSNAMVNCCEKAMAFFLCSLDNCSDLVL